MPFDALKYLEDYNIPYRASGRNVGSGWVGIHCPFSSCPDPSVHGGFNLAGGFYSCWLCGWHSLEKVIMALEGVSYYEAQQRISEYQTTKSNYRQEITISGIKNITFPMGTTNIQSQHREYLIKRGFDPDEIVEKYRILGTGPVSFITTGTKKISFQHRIVIPVTIQRKITSFQGRDITGKSSIKYKPCPKELQVYPLKSTIYNLDNCDTTVVIMEGVLDTWKWGDGAVATFGLQYTEDQLFMLLEHGVKRVVVMFDPEPHAQKQATKLTKDISIFGIKAGRAVLENKDPGELTKEEIGKWKKKLRL
jgi:DNA primase